jgi:gamma-glutamylaminecyclotransferase
MSEKHRVLVYGTLREGQGNHRLIEPSPLIRTVTLSEGYCMVDVGYFPGLIRCDNKNEVTLELYEVSSCQLKDMDWLEGHPDFYTRTEIELDDGKAWVYLLPGEYMSRPIVDSGDWVHYMRHGV